MSEIEIDGRPIGPVHPTFVIAEVGLVHEGSLGLAHAFIDAVADTGADAVKFQTHLASAEATPEETFRVPFSTQDSTRAEYWERTSFAPDQWSELATHAHEVGLVFLSSPFSPEAVDLLAEVGVGAWKVASGQILDVPMLERMAAHPRPVLLSTGMSAYEEIARAVHIVRSFDLPCALFQCTSRYPTSPRDLGLNVLAELRARHDLPVGLSDHSGRPGTIVAATAAGADLIEVHVTLSPRMFGPDVPSSLTVEQLTSAIADLRFVREATQAPVDKDEMAVELEPMRNLFTKSVVAARTMPAGTTLVRADLAAKKPGGGIPPSNIDALVGSVVRRDLAMDEVIRETDVERPQEG